MAWAEHKIKLEAAIAHHEAAVDVREWTRAWRRFLIYSDIHPHSPNPKNPPPAEIPVSQALFDEIRGCLGRLTDYGVLVDGLPPTLCGIPIVVREEATCGR